MIHVQHLVKWYGPTLAVDDLNFEIPKGQIVGFLGPNGAGKTTTLRILTGYMPASQGKASIAGHDVLTESQAARAHIGYLPESTPLYGEMRVEEYLHFVGKLHALPRKDRQQRVGHVVDRCGLQLVRRRVISKLSKGNKQRVGLAQALLHDPPVLILDEPTAGFDPNQVQQVRELIRELREDRTILLSTHILPEIERIADRALIIAAGRIRYDGPVSQQREVVIEMQGDAKPAAAAMENVPNVKTVTTTALPDGWTRLTVTGDDRHDLRPALGQIIAQQQLAIRQFGHDLGGLERRFREVTLAPGSAPAPGSNAGNTVSATEVA